MAPLAAIATIASVGLSAVGTIMGSQAARAEGKQAQANAMYQAKQTEMKAQETRAVSQRQALDQRRQGNLQQSRLQALAASSGGGADDPTIVKLGEDIAGQTEYQALANIYTGENQARGLDDQSQALIAQGQAARAGANAKAKGLMIQGASGIFKDITGFAAGGAKGGYG